MSGSCCCPDGWLGQSCRRRPALIAIIELESVGRVVGLTPGTCCLPAGTPSPV